jgi:frataxin-like iron-binding protein CyaY
VSPDASFPYSWEFKGATTVEMSLGRTSSQAKYTLKDNVIYIENLAKTTMVLVRREPSQLVWAHLLGSSFEAYYYVKR